MAYLLVFGLADRKTALGNIRAERASQPIKYWALMAFYGATVVNSLIWAIVNWIAR